jgi:hypothetical protein
MKRTAEELLALREKRQGTDRENIRKERRLAAMRTRRAKLVDGDLVKELRLTTEEMRGMVLDAKDPATRKRWARMGSSRGSREVPSQAPVSAPPEPGAAAPLSEAAE